MFGFLGKHQGQIEYSANGVPSGTSRRFWIYLGSENVPVGVDGLNKAGFLEFDIDNVNIVKPDLTGTLLNDSTFTTYGVETSNYLLYRLSMGGQTNGRLFDSLHTIPTSNYRGWTYNSNSSLSPASRKMRYTLITPELVNFIGIPASQNNAGKTSINNNTTGELNFNLNQFPNLKYFYLIEGWADTINIKMDQCKKLEIFAINEYNNLSVLNFKIPSTVKYIWLGEMALVTSINDIVSEAIACESLHLAGYSPSPTMINITTTLTGSFDVEHMINLREFVMPLNNGLTEINLPILPPNQWRVFHCLASSVAFATIPNSILENVLTSSELQYFDIHNNKKVWEKNLGDEEFSSNLRGFNIYDNNIIGDITITNSKPFLKSFILGLNQNENNRITNIDLSGLDGGVLDTLQIQGVECENLQLPDSLPNLTNFTAYDNKLDRTTNPDLIEKINNYINLVNLNLGNGSSSSNETSHFGQNSVNGLGNNGDLSSLTSLTTLNINKCGLSGNWILPNINKLLILSLAYNPSLTGVTNFSAHTGIDTLDWSFTNVDLNLSYTTKLRQIRCTSNSGQTIIDLTNRDATSTFTSFNVSFNTKLTTINLPASENNILFIGGLVSQITNNPLLTTIINLENINYNGVTTHNNIFNCNDNSLNIPFPLGIKNFIPRNINLSNNNISTSNINASIDNIYLNRTKWNSYTGNKVLNIGGSNAHASGIYQAPSGFSMSISDGTPVSAAEQLYVLANNYEWTITFNAEVIAGIHWSSVSGSYNALWSSVAYGDGVFVAVAKSGAGDRTMYSVDSGATWTMRSSATNYWMWVTYGNGLFVAVGADGSNRVMTSPDGVTWTSRTSAAEFNQWNSVVYGNGLFVAVSVNGTGNRVMTSPDGINWTSRSSAADNQWKSVTYGNGLFVAVASSGTGDRVMTSPDGINWTSRSSASDNAWEGVTYGNGLFVAVASSGTGDRVMTSPDGINWTSRSSASDNQWKSVAYGNNLFVAVSKTGTATDRVMTSADGITWTTRTSAGTTNNEWQGITYGNGQFIAVSHASSNWIMKSP